MLAHDADLNDTIHYSILAPAEQPQQEQCAKLFEFANATSGQLGLRPGVRQLEASQCQLLVQASDSLSPAAGRHRQQARVTVHVAPQLLGRPLSLFALPAAVSRGEPDARLLVQSRAAGPGGQPAKSSRGRQMSLGQMDSQQGESSTTSSVVVQRQPSGPPMPSSQRSSLATVLASVQHMVKGAGSLDAPMSSALLLSLLLAFLVCLLLIVVVSMSVHVYRRRSKSHRCRRHLTAAAHLRHAHLAGLTCGPSGGAGGGLMSPCKQPPTSSSSSAASSASYTATNSTSPASSSPSSQTSSRVVSRAAGCSGKLGTTEAKRQSALMPSVAGTNSASDETPANANDTSLTTAGSAQPNGSPSSALAEQPELGKPIVPRQEAPRRPPLEELKISTDLVEVAAGRLEQTAGLLLESLAPLETEKPAAHSLVSSLTISTLTTTNGRRSRAGPSSALSTDDSSSAAQCGHYSVNGTIENRQQRRPNGAAPARGAARQAAESPGSEREDEEALQRSKTSRLLSEMKSELAQQRGRRHLLAAGKACAKPKGSQQQQRLAGAKGKAKGSLEAAIRSLARQERDATDELAGADDDEADGEPDEEPEAAPARQKFKPQLNCDASEVSELMAGGQPGIRSYRRLPLMNSLARAGRPRGPSSRVAPSEAPAATKHFGDTTEQGALAALVRETSAKSTKSISSTGAELVGQQHKQIRWPSGAQPQRIKRLTWDDELSCCQDADTFDRRRELQGSACDQDECYVAPDVQLVGLTSPLSREHHYSALMGPQADCLYAPPASGRLEAAARLNYGSYLPPLSGQQRTFAGLDSCMPTHSFPSADQRLQNNRNNCLDYTIVQTSQFYADSISTMPPGAALTGAVGSPSRQQRSLGPNCDEERDYLYATNQGTQGPLQQRRSESGAGSRTPSQHYYYEQSLGCGELNEAELQPSLANTESGGQLEATYKLNQNFQDLKLMTTAVL